MELPLWEEESSDRGATLEDEARAYKMPFMSVVLKANMSCLFRILAWTNCNQGALISPLLIAYLRRFIKQKGHCPSRPGTAGFLFAMSIQQVLRV